MLLSWALAPEMKGNIDQVRTWGSNPVPYRPMVQFGETQESLGMVSTWGFSHKWERLGAPFPSSQDNGDNLDPWHCPQANTKNVFCLVSWNTILTASWPVTRTSQLLTVIMKLIWVVCNLEVRTKSFPRSGNKRLPTSIHHLYTSKHKGAYLPGVG